MLSKPEACQNRSMIDKNVESNAPMPAPGCITELNLHTLFCERKISFELYFPLSRFRDIFSLISVT